MTQDQKNKTIKHIKAIGKFAENNTWRFGAYKTGITYIKEHAKQSYKDGKSESRSMLYPKTPSI
jgi:hypothetical protein